MCAGKFACGDDRQHHRTNRALITFSQTDLLPGLRAVGVLDVFSPRSAAIASLVRETARDDR